MAARARRPSRKKGQVRQREPARLPASRRRGSAALWRGRAFVLLLFVLAISLRVANLTSQSLWADEGNSVRLTERRLSLVVDAARADIHPPGYYVLLWVWVRLFGQGEAAVRALSVAIGVALVGMIYLTGRRWLGARAGWLAAFCAAVSPFQVVYSQEVRMYILVAFLGAVATFALARWIEGREGRMRLAWSIVYALATAAGLWTHYTFALVPLVLSAGWLVWWLGRGEGGRESRGLLWWVGTHLIVMVLYLPWLPTAWSRVFGYGAISASHTVSYVVAQAFKLLSVGETVPSDDLTRWLVLGTVGLAAFGAWGGFAPTGSTKRRVSVPITATLVLLVLAPIVLMVALALTGRPAYRPKFFLVASPAFCLLAGSGVALLERTQPGERRTLASQLWLLLGMGIVGVGAARSLRNYAADPAYARSDYRGIASLITSVEREDDAVLLNAPNQWEVFTYYYDGHAEVYPLCRSRPPDEGQVGAELESIAARHERLFVLYWATQESDPERIVERWLAANAFKASDTWYGDVRLAVYGSDGGAGAPTATHSLGHVLLGDAIALRGYSVAPTQARRGDILQLTAFWEALGVPAGRYKVFVHLADAGGRVIAQSDGEPGDGMSLTSNWSPDQGVFPDRYGVFVPVALASGEYQLLMGLYEVSDGSRLPIQVDGAPAGDAFPLAAVRVE